MENVKIATQYKEIIILPHSFQAVDADFLNRIRLVVAARISALQADMKYTLKQICGKDFWDELNDGERRRAGWCMMHFVVRGELPLSKAESRHEYPIYYRRV